MSTTCCTGGVVVGDKVTITSAGKRLLAEKVDSREQMELCRELGFTLFQGYYFANVSLEEGFDESHERVVFNITDPGFQDFRTDASRLETVVRDTASDPTKAVNAVAELTQRAKVSMIFGPLNSGEALATTPIMARAKMPDIHPCVVETLIDTTKFPNAFRMAPSRSFA